jgi:hypothetical protein
MKSFKTLRQNHREDAFIVTGIRNDEGVLLNPADYIYEHAIGKILKVNVETAHALDSDEWGNPIYSNWMAGAYAVSKAGAIWNEEVAIWRERIRSQPLGDDEDDFDGLGGFGHTSSGVLQIGDDFSDEDIERAFQLDWKQTKWPWLEAKPADTDMHVLKLTVRDNYRILCKIFTHFCGSGQVGQRYGLSVREFGHILHICKYFDMNNIDDRFAIEDIYWTTSRMFRPRNAQKDMARSRNESKSSGLGLRGSDSKSSIGLGIDEYKGTESYFRENANNTE